MPTIIEPSHGLPNWLNQLLADVAMSPMAGLKPPPPGGGYEGPILKSLGRPTSELMGQVFSPTQPGTGIPKRLTLSNWNANTGKLQFHGDSQALSPVFEATPEEIDQLINGGALDYAKEGTKAAANKIRTKLQKMLGPYPPATPNP